MSLNIEYLMKNKCNYAIVENNTIRPCGEYSKNAIYDENDKIWDYYCSEHYPKVSENKINNEESEISENKEDCWCSKNKCWCCEDRNKLCCKDIKKIMCNCQMTILGEKYKENWKKDIVCLMHRKHTNNYIGNENK